ncbi:transcription factor IIIB 50 kDa subunit isoform X2 [Pipistrellus kuhlii]|uniref:Transcription factor IIIB 50 kDa subunit n=1 Tax=Pipistrellus kuhlii TaxID=59472 RepID=A0A7J7ZFV2_PIPKU|nr:transcription factor IIIB 50 kDa subunit isoform X2 [Pipistrellus kuhlii]KAF6373051.1 BRF2 RNA polymerase III transcription initiation factor subunit [Pipistrellus kuhlii]
MPGGGRCPDCGSAELVEDAHYSQSQLVCSDCGCVVTEGVLTTTFSDEVNLREVAYSRSTGENEQVSRSQQRGLRRVRDLCRVLQLPSTFEDTAVAYYQKAYQHPGIRAARVQKKEVLVGCCVLITCRQHNWPLTMGTICTLLYADLDMFSGTYMQIVKLLGLDVPSLCLADLVKTYCSSFKLFQASPSMPAKFMEDKEKMLSRTLQLVELADETWLVTGRHPLPVITAAAFLAWQSLQPSARLTCSLARFCKLANVDLPYPASSRLQELLAVLLRMAEQLAWLQVLKLDKRSVVKHISDLLQHRHTLIRKAFREGPSGVEAPAEELWGRGQGQEEVGNGSSDLPKGKRPASPALLLPPCMLKPPKRVCPTPPASTVTGDEDISDSEIEQYLRTPQEVRDFQRAQAAKRAATSSPNPP